MSEQLELLQDRLDMLILTQYRWLHSSVTAFSCASSRFPVISSSRSIRALLVGALPADRQRIGLIRKQAHSEILSAHSRGG
jgi:hypothetical protein